MLFGTDPGWLSNQFSTPESPNQFSKTDSPIKVVVIDSQAIIAIRAELKEWGVTESVIFLDL